MRKCNLGGGCLAPEVPFHMCNWTLVMEQRWHSKPYRSAARQCLCNRTCTASDPEVWTLGASCLAIPPDADSLSCSGTPAYHYSGGPNHLVQDGQRKWGVGQPAPATHHVHADERPSCTPGLKNQRGQLGPGVLHDSGGHARPSRLVAARSPSASSFCGSRRK